VVDVTSVSVCGWFSVREECQWIVFKCGVPRLFSIGLAQPRRWKPAERRGLVPANSQKEKAVDSEK